MFRQDFKNSFKNKIMHNNKSISNLFNLIRVTIDFNNNLYKRAVKK
jgi:hypothetical protein